MLARNAPAQFQCPVWLEGRATEAAGGAPVEHVAVSVRDARIEVTTDEWGRYRIVLSCEQVRPRVELSFRRLGYITINRSVTVANSSTIRVDAPLERMAIGLMGTVVVDEDDDRPARPIRYAEFRAGTSIAVTIGDPFDRRSFSTVRRFLWDREIPPRDAFGIEGLIAHFPMQWPARANRASMALTLDEIPAPWKSSHRLLRASLMASPARRRGPPRNIVFIVDASGMLWYRHSPLRDALADVVGALDSLDRVSILTFDGPTDEVLVGARGDQHARIRSALDSLDIGGRKRPGLVALAADAARAGAGAGRETRLLVITGSELPFTDVGSSGLVEAAARLHGEGLRLDVLRLERGEGDGSVGTLARAGGGRVFNGASDAELHRSLAQILGIELPVRATRPQFELRFDPAVIARWRCLNDVGEATQSAGRRSRATTLYAGGSVTLLCETELVPGSRGRGAGASIGATYRDADGTLHGLNGIAAPDTALHEDTRLLASVAAFGLLLQGPNGAGTWSFDSAAASATRLASRDRGGYLAELIRMVELAKKAR
jgi:Ca-activated chloride channel homolog